MASLNDQLKPQDDEAQEAAAGQQEPAAQETQEEGANQGGEQATPQEQDAYEKVVLAGLKILFDPSTHQQIVQMLQQGADDPAQACADVTVMVMSQLDQHSKGTIPETVIVPAAGEILGNVCDLAQKANLFQVDDATKEKAVQLMLVGLAKQYGIDPAEVQQLIEQNPDVVKQIQPQQGQQPGAMNQAMAQPEEA